MTDPDERVGGSLTEGSLARPMFALAWPIVATQLLQVAYNLTDTLWLGRFSTNAVAAISLAFPLVFLFISIGGGLNVAGSTLVAQYTGRANDASSVGGTDPEDAGDRGTNSEPNQDPDPHIADTGSHSRTAGTVAGQTLTVVTAAAVTFGVLGFFLTDDLLGVLPSSPATAGAVVPLAADYMEVFFLGLPFLFGFFVFSSLMRGYGNTRAPMVVMAVSVFINVVIDPLLIFGYGPVPQFGVQGAALATVLSRTVATIIGLYVLLGTSAGPRVRLSDFRPQVRFVKQIVRVGVPSAVEQSASALGFITLTAMVVTFKPEVVAAFGLGNRLTSLVFLPALGLGRATNTIVGQNLGAGKPERAERATWLAAKVASGVMVVVAIVTVFLGDEVVALFISTGTDAAAETIRLGGEYLTVRALEFGFIGVLQVVLGAYRGAGNTKTALAFSLVALWLGRVPIVYVLAVAGDFGPFGIWVGMAVGQILGAIAAALWFTRGTWKAAVIDDADAEAEAEAEADADAEAETDVDAEVDADADTA